ncbi:MAG: alginate lyase family protein [Caldilineaceae bacterium]
MSEATQPTIHTRLWSFDVLVANRQRLRQQDAALLSAYQKLLHEADKALTAGPFSVLDKPMTAPSGDKHDYYSVGPYWWPNPNTTDGLPYVRRDGEVNPERARYDATARSHMENAVVTLALAWFFSNDERYTTHATQLLRTWFLDSATRMTPHLEYSQAIPGICDGRGIGIIETHTFPTLLDAVTLLGASNAWTADDQAELQQWFRTYLDWLLTSKHGRDEAQEHNNHGTWYDVQVAAFAFFVADQHHAHLVLSQNTSRRIISQIEPDGSQPHELARTRSLSYSVMNLLGLMNAAALGSHVGIDLWHFPTEDGRGLHKAVDFLLTNALDRPWAGQQITDASTEQLLPILYRAATIYGDARYAERVAQLRNQYPANRTHLLYTLAAKAQ